MLSKAKNAAKHEERDLYPGPLGFIAYVLSLILLFLAVGREMDKVFLFKHHIPLDI